MKSAELPITRPFSTKVPFSREEIARFRSHLKAHGTKAGPWFRTLALRAMDEEAALGDSCGQAREMKAFLASLSVDQLRLLTTREPSGAPAADTAAADRSGGAA